MLKTLFSKNSGGANESSPSAMPREDTLDLVPIVAVTEQSLLTKDGAFIQMFEVPTIEIDSGGERLAALHAGWHEALGKLPPEMKLQISTFIEPRDPTDDLDYFLRVEKHWSSQASEVGNAISNGRLQRHYLALQKAANDMAAQVIVNYDRQRPTTWRFLLTISFRVGLQGPGFGPKGTPREKADAWLSQVDQAHKALREKAAFLYRAFVKSNVPLIALSPPEMCQVIWQGLHPDATGAKGSSAIEIADSMVRKYRNPKRNRPEPTSFYPGMTTEELADLLAPDTVYEESSAIIVDDIHLAGYVIYDFEPNKPVFLNQLLNMPGGFIAGVHLEIFDPATYYQSLKQREVQLRASEDAKARKGVIESMSDRSEIGAVQNARYDLEITGKPPYFMQFYLIRTAPSKEMLEDRCLGLESNLKTLGVKFFRATYSQMPLWKSTFPTGNFVLPQKPRNMTAESLSTFWPPIGRFFDKDGIYLGVDQNSQVPVILDPFGARKDRNPSYLVLGQSSSGKSVYFRTLMVSALLTGAKVFALDIEGEFEELTRHYGGKYINIGTNQGDRLNILDIPPNSEDGYIAAVEQLIAFFSVLRNAPILPGREWNVLEEALRLVLNDRGWLKEDEAGKTYVTNWSSRDAPRLSDLTRALEHFQEVGVSLAEMAKSFSDGMFAPHFNVSTTVDISNEQFVIFNLKIPGSASREILLRLHLWQIMGIIWNEILHSNSKNPSMGHYVFIDELWSILDAPGGGRYIENFVRRLRKRRGSIWMATQLIDEFLDHKAGKRILSGTGNIMLLEQRPIQANLIQRAAGLSDYITTQMTKIKQGNGILLLPNNSIHLSFFVDQKENDAVVPESWHTIKEDNQFKGTGY